MSNARLRQVRLERKLRRREKRRRAKQGAAGNSAELVRLVLSPEGQEPDPARLAESPKTLMSGALVELMRPYISWPPAPDELDDLEAWLRLGADIWNYDGG